MLKFICENWSYIIDGLLVIGGFTAFFIYWCQKRQEIFSAGTAIVGQIMLIEENISILKEKPKLNNVEIYYSKPIIKENMWEKYKHLFAKKLTEAEYELMQRFFNHAEQVERARLDIINAMTNTWKDKSMVEYQLIGDMLFTNIIGEKNNGEKNKSSEGDDEEEKNNINWSEKIKESCEYISQLDVLFTPNAPVNLLTQSINNVQMISGTTAYSKIHKHSYNK